MHKYADYRAEIRSGDLLIWSTTNKSILSKLVTAIIRLFTLSEYSHVGIAWSIGNRLFVIEATGNGVVITPLSSTKSFYHIPMHLYWKPEYDTHLLNKVGQSYSYLDAIKGYLGYLKPNSNNSWQCAELANDFYRSTGRDYGTNLTPSTLVAAILQNGHTISYVNNVK